MYFTCFLNLIIINQKIAEKWGVLKDYSTLVFTETQITFSLCITTDLLYFAGQEPLFSTRISHG